MIVARGEKEGRGRTYGSTEERLTPGEVPSGGSKRIPRLWDDDDPDLWGLGASEVGIVLYHPEHTNNFRPGRHSFPSKSGRFTSRETT
jgi:hypothetical protein